MLLTEHHLEFLSLKKGDTQARLSLYLSKCHIVGNHMSQLINKELCVTTIESPLKKGTWGYDAFSVVYVAMQRYAQPG